MIKTTIHGILFVALAVAAAYAYDQVRFGERTASFFRVAFSEEGGARQGRGRGFDGGGRERDEYGRRRTLEDGSRDGTLREGRRGRPGELRGRGGHGGRGSAVSLQEVACYTMIFAFATMLTYTIDGITKRIVKAGRAVSAKNAAADDFA